MSSIARQMDEEETQKMKGHPSTPVRAADAATVRTTAVSEAKKTANAEPASEVAAHAVDDEATFVSPSSRSSRSAPCTATR
jgi:uncharacterized protein involved in copper resistance